ncbi:MAG: AsnC family transcriptional regulator [Dehalococcoidia bacterium]
MPEVELDDLDRGVIAELQTDPRMPYAALGKQLGVSGMTAATRLNRLRGAGILRCKALPNFQKLGLTTEVFAFIQTDLAALPQIMETLQASPYVLRIDRVAGEFDLSFHAAFRADSALGTLVKALQSVAGMRRLVVHHVLENRREADGWAAVLAAETPAEEPVYELASGLQLAPAIEQQVALAAAWVDALVRADQPRLRELSTPDIVFSIMPPHPSAGTFSGIDAVEVQAERTRHAYRQLWYRIISVSEAQDPYAIVIDALSPVETQRGRVGTAFSRMAFAFTAGRVEKVTSLGQMEIPDVSTGGPFYPKLPG